MEADLYVNDVRAVMEAGTIFVDTVFSVFMVFDIHVRMVRRINFYNSNYMLSVPINKTNTNRVVTRR